MSGGHLICEMLSTGEMCDSFPTRSRGHMPNDIDVRRLRIIAQDPSVRQLRGRNSGSILTAHVQIPAEDLRAGPWGYRVQVIDYDASSQIAFKPFDSLSATTPDRYHDVSDARILKDPRFHCQNVYALVMHTLARFEHALGRRLRWGFGSHHLIVLPHAFRGANAYYSPRDHALLFGYFAGAAERTIYTCLSHDVIVHETTHALLHGLRERFNDPSSPDQAAFHEGFADVVALLSVFSLHEVAAVILNHTSPVASPNAEDSGLISDKAVSVKALRSSGLLGLAEELGRELAGVRGNALRRSVELSPSPTYYKDVPEFRQPHRRGEIFVAAVMNTFVEIWAGRIENLREVRPGFISRDHVINEGAEIAEILLTAVIRAVDYTPQIHIEFGDFLSAVLTSDREARPRDEKYHLRVHMRRTFANYGILPASNLVEGEWEPAPSGLSYRNIHLDSMRSAPDEVFRFIWQNAEALNVNKEAYSRVLSVRPTRRVSQDGFMLEETVAEHHQTIILKARELKRLEIKKPIGMPSDFEVRLRGGGTLIFDEFGRLKYHIHNDIVDAKRQSRRLKDLWALGIFDARSRDFSQIHRSRAIKLSHDTREEEW